MHSPRADAILVLIAVRLTSCLLFVHLAAGNSAMEDNLMNQLLSGYVKDARPPPSNGTTVVFCGMYLLSIDDVEEHMQQFTVSGNMVATWNDTRLSWNASNYNGLDRLVFAADSLWKPDLALTDAVGDVFNGAYFSDYYGIFVKPSGTVTWEQLGSIAVRCDFDLTYYPFDIQSCSFTYNSFNYPNYLLHINTDQATIDMSSYHENAEFSIINTTAYTSFVYIPGDGNYSSVIFTINMKRRELYFMLNLVLPCVLLTLLTCFLFLLPPSSGERVGLSVTVMLSYSVFQLLVAQNLPMNSLTTPLLTTFILTAMFVNGFSLILTILILRTGMKGSTPMPAWVEKHLLHRAGTAFGIFHEPKEQASSASSSTRLMAAVNVIDNLPQQERASIFGSDRVALEALLSSVTKIERSLVKKEQREELAHKWELVSKVIDIIMFIVFLTYDILFCIGTMVIMPANSQ